MSKGSDLYYNLQEIRRIGNIKLEVMGLTMPEIELVFKITALSFVLSAFIQVLANMFSQKEIFILHISMGFFFVLGIIGIVSFNKIYGKGQIFFILATLQNKQKTFLNNLPVLKYIKK